MKIETVKLRGVIKQGLRHASGVDEDGTKHPGAKGFVGTIERQRRFFEGQIPGISEFYDGTINLDIHPKKFEIKKPDYEVICDWREDSIPQTFWFVDVVLDHDSDLHKGVVYYPCPRQEKPRKRESTFELLFPFIPNLNYGDQVSMSYPPNQITIR